MREVLAADLPSPHRRFPEDPMFVPRRGNHRLIYVRRSQRLETALHFLTYRYFGEDWPGSRGGVSLSASRTPVMRLPAPAPSPPPGSGPRFGVHFRIASRQ